MSSTTTYPIASPSVLPPNPSPRLLFILDLVNAFVAMDFPRAFASLSDHVKVQALPEDTFKTMGKFTEVDKVGMGSELQRFKDVIKDPKLTILEIIDSDSQNKVVLHARGEGKILPDKAFSMEYIVILTVAGDPNGELKVVEYKSFVDTLKFQEFVGPTTLMQV